MAHSNETLIQELMREGCLKTPLLIEAFRAVDRKDFVPPEIAHRAYENEPLPIGFGQTISQPLTVAFMLELLLPRPGDKILDVGVGSGYQAALLAYCVTRPSGGRDTRGRIIALERVPALKIVAVVNLSKYGFAGQDVVRVILGDASRGYAAEAPYDKIISAASAPHALPVEWKHEVKVHGRIVAPVGSAIQVVERRSPAEYETNEYAGFRFVPLISTDGSE